MFTGAMHIHTVVQDPIVTSLSQRRLGAEAAQSETTCGSQTQSISAEYHDSNTTVKTTNVDADAHSPMVTRPRSGTCMGECAKTIELKH